MIGIERYSMANKILWLSDADIQGSGYSSITNPLCNALTDLGHEVKEIGLGYHGEEHWNKFGIIPARDFNDVIASMKNFSFKWKPDVFVCALDIPHQEKLLGILGGEGFPYKYIGIMPIEAGPLCVSWAMALMQMNKCFIISEYGANEARKVGLSVEHLQIGIDTNLWLYRTPEEKSKVRESIGIDDDTFVVLTVADNQERKNPHRLLETYADFSKGKKTKYILVTREWNLAGGRLRDYAQELGISQHFMLMERGMSQEQLRKLYVASDAFLLASKAEGLCLPILEAMSVGVPVIATNCTAIPELLADGRGLLVDYEYQHRDCFGNGFRYWFSKDCGVEKLNYIYENGFDTKPAREYVEKRSWNIPTKQLDAAIKEVLK